VGLSRDLAAIARELGAGEYARLVAALVRVDLAKDFDTIRLAAGSP
jgi:hypothetical protein